MKKIFYSTVALLFLTSALPAQALTYTEIVDQGQVLGDAAMATYPYLTGTLVNDGGTIYFISGNTKTPFASWGAFVGLGYSLKNVINGDVSNYLPSDYVISTAKATHPWGQMISYKNTIYYASQQGLIAIPSAAVFTGNGGQWSWVVKANSYDLAVLKTSGGLPLLAAGDSRVITVPEYQFSSSPSNAVSAPATTTTNTTPASQPTTVGPAGTLNTPTLSSTSQASQFVMAGTTNQPSATFNFTALGNPVTITEMDFIVTVNSIPSINPPITAVYVSGNSASVLTGGGTSTVTGLNISVPTTAAGVNVPVTVNYSSVNPPSNASNQVFTLNLVAVKYMSGGQTMVLTTNLASNPMDLIASQPVVSITGPAGQITDGQVLLAHVTVSAIGGGGITFNQIPISITTTGNVIASTSPNNLLVTDGGYVVNTSNVAVGFGVGGGATTNIVFNGDNYVAPNSSKTYAISLIVEGAVGSDAGTSTITTSLGDAGGFVFNDIEGGTTGMQIAGNTSGAIIPNYPTTGVTAHN